MVLINRLLIFVLVFAILVVVKYGLDVYRAVKTNGQWKKTIVDEIVLGSALSYIFTIIFTGLL